MATNNVDSVPTYPQLTVAMLAVLIANGIATRRTSGTTLVEFFGLLFLPTYATYDQSVVPGFGVRFTACSDSSRNHYCFFYSERLG